jgi:hypothetical protein
MRSAAIACQLGGQRQGDNWRAPCPCGCGYSLSLADGKDGRLLAFCFGGCQFNQIALALVEYGLLDDDDGDLQVSRPVTVCRSDEAQRIALARQIYDRGVWDERIAVYLDSRKIGLTSPVLRFQEQAPHRLGARLPAMLAPVVKVGAGLARMERTAAPVDGGGRRLRHRQVPRR